MRDREADTRAEARRVLESCMITRPDQIDLDVIAESMDAEIVCDDLDGAAASVMRIGAHAKIRISNRISDIGAQRFSGGHELGHIRLGHDIPPDNAGRIAELVCKPLEKSRKVPERLASVFASELVMPESMIKPYCAIPCVTLAAAREIASEFTTSVLASAMRFTELSAERCAVAYSLRGRVMWLKRSATFPDWIPRGRRLDPTCAASDYARTGTLDGGVHVLEADAWLPRDRIDSARVQIIEQSAMIPELGAVFTMLWLPNTAIAHLDLARPLGDQSFGARSRRPSHT
ncbi:MAG TPA: ImmA/IrrE family metallo-endopeptidase [Polyangiales bacterium]|jgi:Zn-dependent peptidase ImmA (M78 family)|nr:ImmA/IrrE family metallo-endopeptidase [Polyangiales bacterium]